MQKLVQLYNDYRVQSLCAYYYDVAEVSPSTLEEWSKVQLELNAIKQEISQSFPSLHVDAVLDSYDKCKRRGPSKGNDSLISFKEVDTEMETVPLETLRMQESLQLRTCTKRKRKGTGQDGPVSKAARFG